MVVTKEPIATDSATELHNLVGDDATATFESDPTFVDSNPTGNASSENVEVQRDMDDAAADSDEEDDDDDDDDAEEADEEEVEAEADYQRTAGVGR